MVRRLMEGASLAIINQTWKYIYILLYFVLGVSLGRLGD